MAKRRTKRRRRRVHCKMVTVKGRRRRMCWGPKGKLVKTKRRRKGRRRRRR